MATNSSTAAAGTQPTTALSAPPRPPASTTFDYSFTMTDHKTLFAGFGISDCDWAMDKLVEIVKAKHPYYDAASGSFTGTRLVGGPLAACAREVYNSFLELSDAPTPWRYWAIGKLISYARSQRIERSNKSAKHKKAKKLETNPDTIDDDSGKRPGVSSSKKSAKRKKDEEVETNPDAIDDDLGKHPSVSYSKKSAKGEPYEEHKSDPDAINDYSRKRPRVSYSRDWREESNDTIGTPARQSRQILTPIMEWPLPGPDYHQCTIHLYSVKHGKLDAELITLRPATLQGGANPICWLRLTDEAHSYSGEDDGFTFNGRLFLSPRANQKQPLKTQSALSSALQDMRTGQLIITTAPVEPDESMENGPEGCSALDRVKDEQRIQALLPPTGYHSTVAGKPEARAQNLRENVGIPAVMSMLANYECSSKQPATEHREQAASEQLAAEQTEQPAAEQPAAEQLASEQSASEQSALEQLAAEHTEQPAAEHTEQSAAEQLAAEQTEQSAPAHQHQQTVGADDDDDGGIDGDHIDTDSDIDTMDDDDDDEDGELEVMAEGDDSDMAAQAAMAATKYALDCSGTKKAYQAALKEGLDIWTDSARFYHLQLADLQRKDGQEALVAVPRSVGLSTKYRLFPHQIVGARETFVNLFGDRRSVIEGDEMGFGKSTIVMQVWDANFRAVAQMYGATTVPNTPKDRDPLQWPKLRNGKVEGCDPKIGATWITASPNGIRAFAQAARDMFGGDSAHRYLKEPWLPVFVFLHAEGKAIAEEFGGAKNRMFHQLTPEQWSELLPKPDWDKARPAYHEEQYSSEWRTSNVGEPSKKAHPNATAGSPPATSTRYVIVSTNASWPTRVGHVVTNEQLSKAEKDAAKELTIPSNSRWSETSSRKYRNELAKIKCNKLRSWGQDGSQPMQVTRQQEYRTGAAAKATKLIIDVVDLRYAALVVVDELHSSKNRETHTYTQVIDPFINAGNRPAIMGMTGTALFSGASLFTTFMQKVCMRLADPESEDPGVQGLLRHKGMDFYGTWETIKNLYLSPCLLPSMRRTKLNALPDFAPFIEAFALMLQYYFIARNLQSRDAFGRPLTIIHVGLVTTTRECKHDEAMWARIKCTQESVAALQKARHEEMLAKWEENGAIEADRPAMPALARANPDAYLVARLVSCFPNLLDAIEAWQKTVPPQKWVFQDRDEICLGNNNPVVKSALTDGTRSVQKSFIWDIAKDACRGAVKVTEVVRRIEELEHDKTNMTIKLEGGKQQSVDYHTKIAICVGMRFARALLSAYLHQMGYEGRIADIVDSSTRQKELPKWQAVWDKKRGQVDEGVDILVAGTKVVSQSITLIEGHILYVFDPPPDNNDACQVRKRQHRPGQTYDCEVVELVTVNPETHGKKGKSTDGGAMRTIESRIVARNKGRTEFYESLRDIEATDPTALAEQIDQDQRKTRDDRMRCYT